ncbi:CRISPR-associated protein Cas5 [Sphaerospermopsis sp. LEGE 08334]|nr:CRISPR-associated protein Cas5 [Sphaerospermopsis sp. LEGE 08334]
MTFSQFRLNQIPTFPCPAPSTLIGIIGRKLI